MHRFFKSSFWTQVAIVGLLGFALHIIIQGISLNIVMHYYYMAGRFFLDGVNPYEATLPTGLNNSFKYSPLFGLVVGGMAHAKAQLAVLSLWVLANTTMFALGLRRWCDMSTPAPFYLLFALAAAIIELVVSTGVYQINAIWIGMVLLGIADFRDNRYVTAGAWLMVATNWKIYPFVFLVALLFKFKWRFWLGAFCAGVAVFILPAFFVGWTHNFNMHLAWVKSTMSVAGSYRILDLLSAFDRVGMGTLGVVLDKFLFIATAILFYAYIYLAKKIDWRPWIAFGISAIMLVSPKTEVYTYVALAPAYVYMFYWCLESDRPFLKKYGALIITLLGVTSASCRFIDPTWYRSESPMEIIRVFASLGFWIFTCCILVGPVKTRITEILNARKLAT